MSAARTMIALAGQYNSKARMLVTRRFDKPYNRWSAIAIHEFPIPAHSGIRLVALKQTLNSGGTDQNLTC